MCFVFETELTKCCNQVVSGKESTCQCRRQGLDPRSYIARATKPVHHNYWAHVLHLPKPPCPRACAAQQEKPQHWKACTLQLKSSPCLPQLEEACTWQWRPSTAKISKNFKHKTKSLNLFVQSRSQNSVNFLNHLLVISPSFILFQPHKAVPWIC